MVNQKMIFMAGTKLKKKTKQAILKNKNQLEEHLPANEVILHQPSNVIAYKKTEERQSLLEVNMGRGSQPSAVPDGA